MKPVLDYGFRAVRNSLKAMHQTVTDAFRRCCFRD
jgi:hypothetical protein